MINHVTAPDQSIDDVFKRRELSLLESVADVVKSRVNQEMDGVLTKREADFMQAVSEIVKERTAPPNVIVSPSPSPVAVQATVQADMKPVADAIAAMGQSIITAITLLAETLRQPSLSAPSAPSSPPEKRKITITHDDGSKSVIKEE